MDQASFRPEERAALAVVILVHCALLAVLWHRPPPPPPVPARMAVSLVAEAAPRASAPRPAAAAAPDLAPTLGEAPPLARASATRPTPQAPLTDPIAALAAHNAPVRPRGASADRVAEAFATRPTSQPAGGSRIRADFLKGMASTDSNASSDAAPAALTGAAKAALIDAIARQLKPHWQLPSGVDVEKLVTVLKWDLNPDGSLNGPPTLARPQMGLDALNAPQAARHQEMAIRAVIRAAPFNLPPQYYAYWKHCTFRFDGELAQ